MKLTTVIFVIALSAVSARNLREDSTAAPTTVKPTDAPTTAKPTDAPTDAPTTGVTATNAPTDKPTGETDAPTDKPTGDTNAPTDATTASPATTEDNGASSIFSRSILLLSVVMCFFKF